MKSDLGSRSATETSCRQKGDSAPDRSGEDWLHDGHHLLDSPACHSTSELSLGSKKKRPSLSLPKTE